MFLSPRIVCLLDFCQLLSCYILRPSIWRFYGDVIYMGLWHVNDAREPCLTSIFMNNCVRGAVEMGGGGGTAARPPKVSRAQSLDGGAAEALSSHACRHWPTCSSRLVAFPERRSMLMEEQRNNMLRSGYLMCSCQTLTSHCGCWYTDYRLQIIQMINIIENRDKPGM